MFPEKRKQNAMLRPVLLTGIGELEALVRVRPVGVKLKPQVIGSAVQDQPHELIPGEGPQWTR